MKNCLLFEKRSRLHKWNKKISRNDSDLLLTVTIKQSIQKNMRLRIIVYYQGKYLYTLSNQGILLSFKDSTIAEQKDTALAP